MKAFLLLALFCVVPAWAQKECIFDQASQQQAVADYLKENPNARAGDADGEVIIERDGEVISYARGGCSHYGVAIRVQGLKPLTETELLAKVVALTDEFGRGLVSGEELQAQFDAGNWGESYGSYWVGFDYLGGFEFGQEDDQTVVVNFYMN